MQTSVKSLSPWIAVAALLVWTACSDSQSTPTPPSAEESAPPAAVNSAPPSMSPTDATSANATPADGELDFPSGYTSWPVFLQGIQKPDTKQIRDIYLNATAQGVSEGSAMPDGSVLVMEIYGARTDDAGEPILDDAGSLQKGALSKIFVMAKNPGWGGNAQVPNGAWVYGAFEPNADLAQVDYNACRACHLPLTDQDFVHRLDEYLAQR